MNNRITLLWVSLVHSTRGLITIQSKRHNIATKLKTSQGLKQFFSKDIFSSSSRFDIASMSMTTNTSSNEKKDTSNDNLGLKDCANLDMMESKDDLTNMPLESWRKTINVSIAKSRKIRGGNFVQIATINPETMEPRCRTVVFRGFLSSPPSPTPSESSDEKDNDPCIMKMITDARSSKVQEIQNSNAPCKAEIVWWFSKSSEQYRFLGDVKFVGGGDFELDSNPYYISARKQQWGNLSDPAREQFYWVEPNTPYSGSETKIPVGGREEDGKILPPPDNFLLMLMFPKKVDYLRLGDNYRQVDVTNEDNEWVATRVNP